MSDYSLFLILIILLLVTQITECLFDLKLIAAMTRIEMKLNYLVIKQYYCLPILLSDLIRKLIVVNNYMEILTKMGKGILVEYEYP